MKIIKTIIIGASLLVSNAPLLADDTSACPREISQQDDDAVGGGGISGVGGGGGGFALWKYLNPIFPENFPHMIHLRRLNPSGGTVEPTEVEACVYDQHFGEADTVRLVATLACVGGATITWPRQDSLRVRCEGAFGTERLKFEATTLAGLLMGNLKRILPRNVQATEAVFIGH